jgi:hypothetical protein
LEGRVGVVVRVELRGKRWNLEVIDYLQDGSCGSIDPSDAPQKRILIALNQTPQDLLDTVIHECMHACIPDLAEETVTETSTDIAKVLHRMGCRVVLDGV